MKTLLYIVLILTGILTACQQRPANGAAKGGLSADAAEVRDYVRKDIVISHRGSEFWAPEETEAAFRFARNLGADYLEFDVQLTKDSFLVAFHDSQLDRTTNVASIFPDRADAGVNAFTLAELRMLDAGSWFNEVHPEEARKDFAGLEILTLEDVVRLAEGMRICRLDGKPVCETVGEHAGLFTYEADPQDNGNRPGVYIETKSPKEGVERVLARELTRLGWNINETTVDPVLTTGKVDVGATRARVILQSFSRKSIVKLEKELPGIPKTLLLWKPNMEGPIDSALNDAVAFALANNVHIMGPSIAGEPNNYGELCEDWMLDLYHAAGLLVHPYTFDTEEQFESYKDKVDGVYTNRPDLALDAYERSSQQSAVACLDDLGY